MSTPALAPPKPTAALLASSLVTTGQARYAPPMSRRRNPASGIQRAERDYGYDREAQGRRRRLADIDARIEHGYAPERVDDGRALDIAEALPPIYRRHD